MNVFFWGLFCYMIELVLQKQRPSVFNDVAYCVAWPLSLAPPTIAMLLAKDHLEVF